MPRTTKRASPAAALRTSRSAINIRVEPGERALIDQAASLAGKSRSEFMLDATRRAATDTILDRTLFRVDRATFARFVQRLDATPEPSAALRKLMQTKAPWE